MNIVKAIFSGGCTQITAAGALWQWDQGQILQIVGLDLPDAYQVEFSNQPVRGTAAPMIGGVDGVEIPDVYLTTGKPVYAFVVLHAGEDDRETEYKITIPVNARPQPTDVQPTPEQQGVIDQLIAALNAGVEKAEDAADEAEGAADDAAAQAQAAAQSASSSASYAGDAAAQAGLAAAAKVGAEAAQAAAELAQGSAEAFATAASGAEAAAETAQGKAEDAQDAAEAAQAAAESAKAGALAAKAAAETAQGKAEDAQEAAEQAAQDAHVEYDLLAGQVTAQGQTIAQHGQAIAQNTADIADLDTELTRQKSALNDITLLVTNEDFTWAESWGELSHNLFGVQNGTLVASTYKQNSRIASNWRNPLYVNAGYKFVTPANKQMYIAYSADNTSWIVYGGGWLSGEVVLNNDGYYAFLSRTLPETTITDISAFISDIQAYTPNASLQSDVQTLQNKTAVVNGVTLAMEKGNLGVTDGALIKGTYKQNARIRTSLPLALTKGTTIRFPYGYRLNVFIYGTAWSMWGWTTADYICEEDTQYAFVFGKNDDTDFTGVTVDQIASLIEIRRNNNPVINSQANYLLATNIEPEECKIKSIARCGFNIGNDGTPPENSIDSFKMALQYGYRYMLCDVRWTSDHVPVALHDASINRVARNDDGTEISSTLNISDLTLEEVDTYDFGIIKGTAWARLKILRIADFLKWCILNNCSPILELKNDSLAISSDDMDSLIAIINSYNYGNGCAYVCERSDVATQLHQLYPDATIFFVYSMDTISPEQVQTLLALKGRNKLVVYKFIGVGFNSGITSQEIEVCSANGFELGITECRDEAELNKFLLNTNNLSVNWVAVRDMPMYKYLYKISESNS